MEETALPSPPAPESAGRIVSEYFARLRRILLEPSRFFSSMPLEGSLSGPLAFALVTHWIGTAVDFFVDQGLGLGLTSMTRKIMSWQMDGDDDIDTPARGQAWMTLKSQVTDWLSSSAMVVAAPFWTLLWLLFGAFFVWIGSRLLANQPSRSPRGTYSSALRLVAYGTSPAILTGIPIFGGWLAAIWALVITTVGAREIYQVTTDRALVIALFPRLLVVALGIAALFLFVFVIAGLFYRFA